MKKLSSYYALSVAVFLTAQGVSAHEAIKTAVLEGTGVDNAIVIGHGCEDKDKPIKAQSVVFPTQNPELIASDGRTVSALTEVITSALYAGEVDLIQDKSIFQKQNEKYDSLGNVIGFYSHDGALQTNLTGRVPFHFSAPTFVSSSCATALNIEVAVADVCILSKPTIDAAKVNLWIPDNGSQYAILGKAQMTDGLGEPPVLQVKRDLVNNPLDSSCGAGFVLTVRPSAADIDANLGMMGWHY